MIDRYVDSISPDRDHIIIDVDCTGDRTHGMQQGSLFHGKYWHYIYNELLYLDGETSQVILPVLRPGNVHSSRWNERFLSKIVRKVLWHQNTKLFTTRSSPTRMNLKIGGFCIFTEVYA